MRRSCAAAFLTDRLPSASSRMPPYTSFPAAQGSYVKGEFLAILNMRTRNRDKGRSSFRYIVPPWRVFGMALERTASGLWRPWGGPAAGVATWGTDAPRTSAGRRCRNREGYAAAAGVTDRSDRLEGEFLCPPYWFPPYNTFRSWTTGFIM